MSDPFRQGLDEATGEFAPMWQPEPGDTIIGQVIRYERATTRYGPCDICVLLHEDTGEELAVWILEFVLVKKFMELRPRVGERMGIKYVGKVDRETDNPYKNFVVQVDRDAGDDASIPRFVGEETVPPPLQAAPQGPPGAPQASPPPYTPPPPPSREEQAAEARRRWEAWCRQYRPEEYQLEALAKASPTLEDDMAHWRLEDYSQAFAMLKAHGSAVIQRALHLMKEREPADQELVKKLEDELELGNLGMNTVARVKEAINTGWHDAVVWADRLASSEAGQGSNGEPELPDPPDDDLPF